MSWLSVSSSLLSLVLSLFSYGEGRLEEDASLNYRRTSPEIGERKKSY